MTDIHTIKNLLYFFPYLKEETWYMLGIGIIIYAIYIAYLMVFERYYKVQNHMFHALPPKKSIQEALASLEIEDIHFFERLSFIIRSYLEDSEQVPFATKKTPKDIHREFGSETFKKMLDTCTYYEYTGEIASTEKRTEIIERIRKVLS